MRIVSGVGAFLTCFGLLVGAISPACADEEGQQLRGLVEKAAPCVVSIKIVLKTEFKGMGVARDSESRMTLPGVVVTPDGLIMFSNATFSTERFQEMMGDEAPEGFRFKMTPTSFKAVFAGDEKEYDAFLAATDTKLDLAFVKVEGLGDRKLAYVDFNGGAVPEIGQKVVGISRLPKGYDYAPYFKTGRVSGQITKPRKAWLIDGHISELSLPVYTLSGEVVGVFTTINAGVKDEDDSGAMGFMAMMGEGSDTYGFILPAQTARAVIELAAKQAVEVAAERARKKDEKKEQKPAPAKPAAPGKGK